MPEKKVKVETLVLTGKQVRSLLHMEDVLVAVEEAFRQKGLGQVQMPPKTYLFFPEQDGDLRTMPSYVPEAQVAAVKIVNVHPQNAKYGLRTVMGTLLLVDPRTGEPMAFMDATHITAMRTGAAGAIAAKYLARPDPKVVGVIGAGSQARTQVLGLVTQYGGFEELRIYDLFAERSEALAKELAAEYKLEIQRVRAVPTPEECVRGADIVATVTPSRNPIIKDEWVSEGTHFNCIGADAPGKEEMDPRILKRARLVIDDWEQASHSGEINVPLSSGELVKEDVDAEIGEVVAGLKPGRSSPSEITVFCSTGLAVQDCLTAKLVYEAAMEMGVGKRIDIID
ncbi:MAG TPA: alanine dehydrogenase [Methanomassiliicoccales archaeon]|nr:alanine dehydrogenase [Methanomassiliicoccales archaeon]